MPLPVDELQTDIAADILDSTDTVRGVDYPVDFAGDIPSGIATNQFTTNWYDDGTQLDGRIDIKQGVLTVPVAGPSGTPPRIIQVHAPYAMRKLEWSASRFGARPLLPSSNTNNSKEILAQKSIVTASPAKDPAGRPVYRTSGIYVWALAVTPGPSDCLPVGSTPVYTDASNAFDIQPGDFVSTYTDASACNYTGT